MTTKQKTVLASVLKDISTGKSGDSYDVGRIIGWAGSIVYMAMGVYKLALIPATFSFQEFGVGFGAFAAGIGGMIYLKKDSEPKGDS